MKFDAGYWQLLPGTQAVYPLSVVDVQTEPDALVVTGYSREIRSRDDYLNGTIITARLTSPMQRMS